VLFFSLKMSFCRRGSVEHPTGSLQGHSALALTKHKGSGSRNERCWLVGELETEAPTPQRRLGGKPAGCSLLFSRHIQNFLSLEGIINESLPFDLFSVCFMQVLVLVLTNATHSGTGFDIFPLRCMKVPFLSQCKCSEQLQIQQTYILE
jgi:hypothetical protein